MLAVLPPINSFKILFSNLASILIFNSEITKHSFEAAQSYKFQIFANIKLYDVEIKRYFYLYDIELLHTACSHNSQKHS